MKETASSIDSLADEKLVAALRSGDESAFDALVDRYRDRVFNLCHRILGVQEDTNDCALETFVRARRSLRSLKSGSDCLLWLYRLAAGSCAQRLASAEYRGRKAAPPPPATQAQGAEEEQPAEGTAVASHEDDAQEEKENIVQKVIDSLEHEQRILVVLRDMEMLSYDDISRITGIPADKAASRLAGARERILERLKELI